MYKQIFRFCTESLLKSEASFREKHFVDKLKLKVKAGNGGKGCVCYYRDRIIVSGAPDGGDGGKGGDVYLKASKSIGDFSVFKRPHVKGNDGKQGMRLKSNGKNGNDIRILVPVGTLVYEIDIEADKKNFIADLDVENMEILSAKGGKGGKGNGYHVAVREVQPGQLGQDKQFLLELKILADIGLVGFPNAGKSTLLASVSRALPKIAEYPFTTLNPMVGKIRFIDDFVMSMADIPGLIEDAHQDKGLGLDFLRHIERCRMILYVLDGNDDFEKQYQILRKELGEYNKSILSKPALICVNKMDLKEWDNNYCFGNSGHSFNYLTHSVSAKHGVNVGQLLLSCRQIVEDIRKKEQEEQMQKNKQKGVEERRKILLEKEML